MIFRSVFFLLIFLPSFLSAKSVEDSSWLGQSWSWSSPKREWDGWRLSAASNDSNWMTMPDVNDYFDKIEASFEQFVDQMRSDYKDLSSEVRVKVTRDMETLKKLKERMKEAMMEGSEAVSSYDWRKRLNDTMAVFDDIRVH